ncbi:MAG: hypothetical protein K5984_05060 [Bacteroidales bacterium]|nr:hypothetical protein [Bacteroidales bacterium]
MRYLIRSIKYFIYIVIVLSLMMAVFVVMKLVPADINQMFVNGYDSVWKILGMFAVVSLVYPRFGYAKRTAVSGGTYEELRGTVVAYMQESGYELVKEEDQTMVFRSRSFIDRLVKVFEDKVTVSYTFGGFELEGLNRSVTRFKYGLENRLKG